MRYKYHYRNSANEALADWIEAKDRNDAYARLKAQGIKPFKVEGKDPASWRRWTAIGVLMAVCGILAIALMKVERGPQTAVRNQLYGDPATIQQLTADGFKGAFEDEGDRWLARHAIPGKECDCTGETVEISQKFLKVREGEGEEIKKLKRMVNWMKAEMRDYLKDGGSLADYEALCCERLATERKLQENIASRLQGMAKRFEEGQLGEEEFGAKWEEENKTLRGFGLRTVAMPDEE